jgi:hypothetical protein
MDPESQICEWKRSLSLKQEALEALCGMMNARPGRGKVIFGIAPDGVEVGVEPGNLDRAQQSLAQTIRQKFDPPIQFTVDVTAKDGKKFVTILAERNKGVPYHELGGTAFIREGTTTRRLSVAERKSLTLHRKRMVTYKSIAGALCLIAVVVGAWLYFRKTPVVKIGAILGADKGIGRDAIIDCSKSPYVCMTEDQVKSATPLVLDLGTKGWARVVYKIENFGPVKAENTTVHVDSPDPISIDFAPEPDPKRLPRNLLDRIGGEIQPLEIAKGGYLVPLDVIVPPGLDQISINFKVFGDNLRAHELNLKFKINR